MPKETDLYLPVKNIFIDQGYEVKSEIKSCDIVAIKDNTIIAIELKLKFSLKLVYQILERQKFASKTYIAIQKNNCHHMRNKNFKNIVNLLIHLNVGLILVTFDNSDIYATILLEPTYTKINKNKYLKKILKEFDSRTYDHNLGGTNKKIITAYKQNCIKIAYILKNEGPTSIKDLVTIYNCAPSTNKILYNNYYGWFVRVKFGTYSISDFGIETIKQYDFYNKS